MLIHEVLNIYSVKDFTTVALTESVGDWTITQSTAYRRAYKKYSKDARTMTALQKLMNFITTHDATPPIRSYPPEFNVHMLRVNDWKPNALWAHLKGSQIGLGFNVEPGLIELFCIGTHQDCNV